jgi:hypothetical protein
LRCNHGAVGLAALIAAESEWPEPIEWRPVTVRVDRQTHTIYVYEMNNRSLDSKTK